MLRHTVFKITRNATAARTVKTLAQDPSPEDLVHQEFSYSKVQLLGRVGTDPKLVGLHKNMALFHVFVNYRPIQLSMTESDILGEMIGARSIESNSFTVFATKPLLRTYVMESVRKRTRVLCIGVLSWDSVRNLFTIKLDDIVLIDGPHFKSDQRDTAARNSKS